MDAELLKIILGGGGVGGVIYALVSYMRDRRKHRVMDEDTALSRLREDYERKSREAAKAWRVVQWYRDQYPRLWAAYMRLPLEDKESYAPTPPPEIDN